jgi:threonyl-tRNA synthetase
MKAYLGTSDIWKESEDMLRNIAKDRGPELIEEPGEAAFYGPKIDFLANDSLGREWQVGTIQLDFNMPEAFKLNYVNEKGKKERVVMLHVAIMGSIERFLSILIEHTAGNLPFWLSPEQIWIIPIGEGHHEYAKEVAKKLSEFRVVVKTESESLGKKIRAGELQKIPYLLIVGDKEMKNKKISVRFSNDGDLTSVRSFLHRLPFLKLP